MNEVELIFTELLGCSRSQLYLDRARMLSRPVSAALAMALRCRMRRQPLEYILGKTEFMGLEFAVTPAVLIPRPDTEVLVETVEQIIRSRRRPVLALEIGTGSGCIAVSLAVRNPQLRVHATDISAAALDVARVNARRHGVEAAVSFFEADLFVAAAAHGRRYDLIISNPPYVKSDEIPSLQPEVRYEPRTALDGGIDGLCFYRRIMASLAQHLAPDGVACFEIGFGQRAAIEDIVRGGKKFEVRRVIQDYNSIDRVAVIGARG